MNFIIDIVVGFGERGEAAGERRQTVEGEDFDDEGEVQVRARVQVRAWVFTQQGLDLGLGI